MIKTLYRKVLSKRIDSENEEKSIKLHFISYFAWHFEFLPLISMGSRVNGWIFNIGWLFWVIRIEYDNGKTPF